MDRLLAVAVLFSLLTAATAVQTTNGIYFVQRVTSGGPPITVRVQIEATRMRTETAGPTEVTNVMIFDGGTQLLQIVDPARKTYVEMTKADVDRLSAQVQDAMAQMKAQLAKLPPPQRAQMEALMAGGGGAAALQYTRTGSDTVGRWTCDKYDVTQGGRKLGEVCSVKPAALGFGAADFEVMRQMGAFYAAMGPLIATQLPGMSGIDQRGSPDFPVRTVMMFQGQTVTTEVIEAGRQTFPDSSWTVPASFAKQDVRTLMGGIGPER